MVRDFLHGIPPERIIETKTMNGRRLTVRLDYEEGTTDRVEWELVTPEELRARVAPMGLRQLPRCSGFDESVAPDGDRPRFQAIVERV